VGFEPAIPAGEWLQTHALDRAATGIGKKCTLNKIKQNVCFDFLYKFYLKLLLTQEEFSKILS
jgi:hypothetical protein